MISINFIKNKKKREEIWYLSNPDEKGKLEQIGLKQNCSILYQLMEVFHSFIFFKKYINKSVLRVLFSEVKVSTAGLKIAKFTSFIWNS